jgi:radical SAM protein with 4Fe4S-binding SPASM domain
VCSSDLSPSGFSTIDRGRARMPCAPADASVRGMTTAATPPRPAPFGAPGAVAWDINSQPVVVAWEVTRACQYRCNHCRADAQPHPTPGELDAREALGLVDQLGGFAGSILVLTGGDPLQRKDLEGLVAHATDRGLRPALTPSATPRVTRERLAALKDAGLAQVALSLDSATPAGHDTMRGVRGSFRRTLDIMAMARELGFPLQVNTTITRHNVAQMDAMAEIVAGTGAAVWSVFFLVPTGRGQRANVLDAYQHERALRRLARMWGTTPFRIKATAAPSFRRVMAQTGHPAGPAAGFANDGKGFMFISSTGDVSPSGFLPLVAGNVRETSPVDIYRDAPLFRDLRDPAKLTGRCGRCRYRTECGGSRARAYAMTGDPFAEDPTCMYEPGSRVA